MVQNAYTMAGNNAEKILSEIAEEDSVSMVSDKHTRRFKASECATPAEPTAQSFIGSIRESEVAKTQTRLNDNTLSGRQDYKDPVISKLNSFETKNQSQPSIKNKVIPPVPAETVVNPYF